MRPRHPQILTLRGAVLRTIGRLVKRSAKRHERFKKIAEEYDEAKQTIKIMHSVRVP